MIEVSSFGITGVIDSFSSVNDSKLYSKKRCLDTGSYSHFPLTSGLPIERKKIIPIAVTSLSALILSVKPTLGMLEYDSKRKTIVITGCNSGIGFNAALRMANRGHKIIMACRTLKKAEEAAQRISVESDVTIIPAECDLTSLNSIQAFSDKIQNEEIDVLCLNAGISRNVKSKDVLRTKEGYELTVGTNHFGHFYLTQKLLPKINSKDGRIVVTASGVHDPDSPGGAQGKTATLGDLSGLENGPYFEMIDGGSFDADKAYKDSKLCNVFFTREMQRRLDGINSNMKVNCFSPGLIVGTGLFRDQNQVFTKIFDVAATNILRVGETTEWGGGALEYMALDKEVGLKGGLYYNSRPGSSKFGDDAYGKQFEVYDVSNEAKDNNKAKRLWQLSEKLTGITFL